MKVSGTKKDKLLTCFFFKVELFNLSTAFLERCVMHEILQKMQAQQLVHFVAFKQPKLPYRTVTLQVQSCPSLV